MQTRVYVCHTQMTRPNDSPTEKLNKASLSITVLSQIVTLEKYKFGKSQKPQNRMH